MSFADSYLDKHKAIIRYLEEPPSGLLCFSVVIPTYLENKIFDTLNSLKSTRHPKGNIEVLVVVNYSIGDSEENKLINIETYYELLTWGKSNSTDDMRFYTLLAADLPSKHSGVGLARKVGMDQALQRFNLIDLPQGIILSLDADSLVDPDYFRVTEEKLGGKTDFGGCLFYFQHPLEGEEFIPEIYEAITFYELHLRYYKHILQYTGFPYSHYTIGSCFGVKASFYAQQGGMNRRQAGEDFYFLNKLFPHKPFVEINNICVFPSSRPSFRVPFGTGAAVSKIVSSMKHGYESYSPKSFIDLKMLFDSVEVIYNSGTQGNKTLFAIFSEPLKNFLLLSDFHKKIDEIRKNTGSYESFQKRFYLWFDGFKVVKYLNYSHQQLYSKLPVEKAVRKFIELKGFNIDLMNATEMLKYFREIDKCGGELL